MGRGSVSSTMTLLLLLVFGCGSVSGCRSTEERSVVEGSRSFDEGVAAPALGEIDVDALREELLRRRALDQEVRSRPPTQGDVTQSDLFRVDTDNTEWLKGVVDEIGWPTKSLVGEEASFGAFLIVQHADHDVDFQARCLPILAELAQAGEVRKPSVAYLTDRVRQARGEPQLYGTQYSAYQDGPGGPIRYVVPLVEDPERLDERRKAMDLGPWIDYERRMAELQEREPVENPRSAK